MMNVNDARTLLPKVGDKRMEIPTIYKTGSNVEAETLPPEECVVVEVNAAHLWYRVRFSNGWHECYKVPRLKVSPQGRLLG